MVAPEWVDKIAVDVVSDFDAYVQERANTDERMVGGRTKEKCTRVQTTVKSNVNSSPVAARLLRNFSNKIN